MQSKKEAVQTYQAIGLQLMQVHEEALRAHASKTGTLLLPNLDTSVPKRLHRHVRKSSDVSQALIPAMEAVASELRQSQWDPLRCVLDYRQALSTLMKLTASKYDRLKVETVARQLDERMGQLLGFPS